MYSLTVLYLQVLDNTYKHNFVKMLEDDLPLHLYVSISQVIMHVATQQQNYGNCVIRELYIFTILR